ncbi:bZIP transcription factor 49 [Diplogelasinospora grovesii]|uniref:BZIP transcription factor 49 n=1 Tax=Diplogelasinospora grovesii TaxID=303347 RepID=A0AAN6N6I8_9PEZI|nr:bZIP transcription factor 49 [Diplogelasinospora grovesii]
MVSAFQMQSFYTAPLSVDTTHAQKFFDEDASILDENILDQSELDSSLEMSPPMADSRRDSFAVSSTLFSPKSEDWQSVEMQSVPSNNPFLEHSNNPFLRMDQSQQQAYQGHGWPMTSSGSATPMQTFDGLPAEFDTNVPLFHRQPPMPPQTPFGNPGAPVPLFQQLGHQSIPPTSPQKDHWMSQELKNQAMLKRARPASPLIRSHNDLRRGDGIRKKNARFEIPAERNLSNIDQLISQSTDEQEIKELKQQKRLLRNRQAALDSRQRKKQHTERLEDEKKQFTEVISTLEDQIAKMEREMAQLHREKQGYEAYINDMERKQEELISRHTIESGEMRKKISVLTQHIQTLEVSPSSTGPNQPGFGGNFGEMEGITMDGPWENMQMFGDYAMEQTAEIKQEMQMVPVKKPEVAIPADSEKPAQQGGLLFMLFLVGAFVLSSRSTPSIPRVSDDVRAASATLLENVLKDAGVPQATSALGAMAPRPSGTSWGQPSVPSLSIAPPVLDNVAPSMLGDMTDALTQPTEQQTNEQLFGMTAAQYNGISSADFLEHAPAEKSTSQGRRNLAEALAHMRNPNKQSGAAEVYTRSLLWDQIPGDVVRTFAKMVAECNQAQNTAQDVD